MKAMSTLINMDTVLVLLVLLTALDLVVLGVFVAFMKRMKTRGGHEKLLKATEGFEALVMESAGAAERLIGQIKKEEDRLRRLSKDMDEKAVGLKMLCTRAETLLQSCAESRDERPLKTSLTGREKKIIALARTGRRTDEIAGSLALAREEVELVLGLEKKFARLGNEKVRS